MAKDPLDSVVATFRYLFADTQDLVLLLRSDRAVEAANPAYLEGVRLAAVGEDYMRTVAPHGRERVLTALVRAAGGDEVAVSVPHETADGDAIVCEYRFFPAEGGRVAGIGRVRNGSGPDSETFERTRAELRAKNRMLDEIQLELTQVPFIDPVTGVWNRLQVLERLTAEWSRCERYGHAISVLLIDVEALGAVRATDGRETADRMLRVVARRIKGIVRDHDIVGRYGDDSFVVVDVQSNDNGARFLAQRLRAGISDQPLVVDHEATHLTVRVGAATNGSEGVEILEDLFVVAERALERARSADSGFHVADNIVV